MLTPQWLLCIHCFTSLVSLTGFYTEGEPIKLISIAQMFFKMTIMSFSKMTSEVTSVIESKAIARG